jgi:hypothetical protein
MREVCSPLNKPKGPQAGGPGKLPTSPGAFSDPGNVKRSDRKRSDALPPRNLSDPDPHPAASRSGQPATAPIDAVLKR